MVWTMSPTLNTAGEKISTGGGKAAAADKNKKMEKYNELILKRELTFLSSKLLLSHSYFLGLLGRFLGIKIHFRLNTLYLYTKNPDGSSFKVIQIKAI